MYNPQGKKINHSELKFSSHTLNLKSREIKDGKKSTESKIKRKLGVNTSMSQSI